MTTQEQTISRLRLLKLSAMARQYDMQLSQPQTNQLGFDERLSLLVESEVSARENRRLKRLLTSASLPEAAALEEFDARSGRGIEKDALAALATCDWIRRQQNVLISGAGRGQRVAPATSEHFRMLSIASARCWASLRQDCSPCRNER